MEPSQIRRAVEAAKLTARELGLQVNDAVVVHNSERIAVRLIPCDVLVRIGLQVSEDGFEFEAEVARRLAETGNPVGELEPRAGSRVYVRDAFALTLWTYYDQVGNIAPTDYASALIRLHSGLRQIDMAAPHVNDRVATWVEEVNDPEQTPELPGSEREFLSNTFSRVRNTIDRWAPVNQLLHGEPHPGNLLSTSRGPLFIDFHTCQRGPLEYDIAYIPEEAAAHYPGVNQHLVHQFRILMWAGITTMRWLAEDQFPDRDYWRVEGLNQLRAALGRA